MQAAIFDVDGTLIDSVDVHAKAWQEAFAHFGKDVSFEKVRSQIGKGGDQLLPVFLSKEEIAKNGKKLEEFRTQLYRAKYMDTVQGFPGVRQLFQRLLADGWKIALASSAKGEELEFYKERAQIADLIHAETSSDDAEKSKPFPDIFQAAAARLNLPASECVVIGDSPYDAQAASSAGMVSVGFLCGGFPSTDLSSAGYRELFEGAEDLVKNYERSLLFRQAPAHTAQAAVK